MVDPLSLIPLHVETFFDNKQDGLLHTEKKLSDATAFVYSKDSKKYLITNWHVVNGRNPKTKRLLSRKGAVPNIIKVWFHAHGSQLAWAQQTLPLLDWDTEEKLWIEHIRGSEVDLIALPLDSRLVFKYYPLDPILFNTNLDIAPAENVSIIGFPFGLPSSGVLPIWKVGHIASDIGEDYDDKPVFLIDGTIRPGMSGSPVIARRREFVSEDKRILISLDNLDRFLGVFSGGISKKHDTEIGMVWKPELIDEIIERKDDLIKRIKKYKIINLWEK